MFLDHNAEPFSLSVTQAFLVCDTEHLAQLIRVLSGTQRQGKHYVVWRPRAGLAGPWRRMPRQFNLQIRN